MTTTERIDSVFAVLRQWIRVCSTAFCCLLMPWIVLATLSTGLSAQTGPLECSSQMSTSECDHKTQQDLDLAVRNRTQGCLFEPGWRPTNTTESPLHLREITASTLSITVDGRNYVLPNSVCEDQGGLGLCSLWKPETGKDYWGEITERPAYLNPCLHRVLRADREVCIGFGRIKQETFRYGVSRTPEYEVCYSVSGTPGASSAVHVQALTPTQVESSTGRLQAGTPNTTAPIQKPAPQTAIAPLSNNNYYTNSNGDRVHSPAYSPSAVPGGATAVCRDGTYSFSQHRSGTCSHHGGVAKWL
jgi:Protein of unknown function (DUF3761)